MAYPFTKRPGGGIFLSMQTYSLPAEQQDFSKVNGARENARFNWLTLTVTSVSFRYVHVLLVTDHSNVISGSDRTCPIQLSKFLSISLAQSLYNDQ